MRSLDVWIHGLFDAIITTCKIISGDKQIHAWTESKETEARHEIIRRELPAKTPSGSFMLIFYDTARRLRAEEAGAQL